MYFEAFSRNVNQAIDIATALAKRYGCRYIGSEHVLYGLMNVTDGRASAFLREAGVTNERYLHLFERTVDKTLVITGSMFTARTKRLFENALEISLKAHAGYIGTEHLLLAILLAYDSAAVTILQLLKVDVDKMADEVYFSIMGTPDDFEQEEDERTEDDFVSSVRGVPPISRQQKVQKQASEREDDLGELAKFGVNLNKQAREGK